ncbi:MAG: hypothetical protein DYH13_05590 [Alphaproteobacteria bacterium PRO2]|nr:hypothetical protein [Alphaproteobacteria bacterium PRO2]
MNLVQIFLPLFDDQKKIFSSDCFLSVKNQLIDEFGGMTAFTQSPATGLWQNTDDEVVKDRIVIFEVMTEKFDPEWWRSYRRLLEDQFKQDKIIIRTFQIETI